MHSTQQWMEMPNSIPLEIDFDSMVIIRKQITWHQFHSLIHLTTHFMLLGGGVFSPISFFFLWLSHKSHVLHVCEISRFKTVNQQGAPEFQSRMNSLSFLFQRNSGCMTNRRTLWNSWWNILFKVTEVMSNRRTLWNSWHQEITLSVTLLRKVTSKYTRKFLLGF
jgi:hypothetical protein